MSDISDKSAHEAKGMAEAPSADLVAKKTAKVQELIKGIEAGTQADEDLIDILLHEFPEWETDDFAAVKDDFAAVKGPALSELRTLFMRRGVYVGNFRTPGGSVAKFFADIVRTRDIAPWPDSAIKTLVKGGVLQSRNEDLQAAFSTSAIDPRFLSRHHPHATAAGPTRVWEPVAPSYAAQTAAVPTRVWEPAASSNAPKMPTRDARNLPAHGISEYMTPVADVNRRYMSDVHGSVPPEPKYEPPVQIEEKDKQRALREIQRDYPDKKKYTGSSDDMSLSYRFEHFRTYCSDRSLGSDHLHLVLSIMMAEGEVQDYCLEVRRETSDWKEVMNRIALRFETTDVVRMRFTKWSSLSIQDVVEEAPDQPMSKVIQVLYQRLARGQKSFEGNLKTQQFLYMRLANAYENDPRTSEYAIQAVSSTTTPEALYRRMQEQASGRERTVRLAATMPNVYSSIHNAVSETMYSDRTYGSRTAPARRKNATGAGAPTKQFKCYLCVTKVHPM
ncbi:hypothetical protein SEPCBS119000_006748 [Sporothrix epigloea]|uniref:Uncharacterized protein n=1 Tax=Sporothrix epigloea TaxID=1892477 RepID=A0ABP0E524_9PEZI